MPAATRLLAVAAIGRADEDDGMRAGVARQEEIGEEPDAIGHGDGDIALDRDAEAWWWQPQEPRFKLCVSPGALWCNRALRRCGWLARPRRHHALLFIAQ